MDTGNKKMSNEYQHENRDWILVDNWQGMMNSYR